MLTADFRCQEAAMNRLLATTATAALCAAWMAAIPARADDAPATAPAPAAASSQPGTMQDAINVQVAAATAERQQGHIAEAAKAFSQVKLVAPADPVVRG